MKLTKTELKEMIREIIREELAGQSLNEEKEFRSEYAKLMSTPEGKAKFRAMSHEERHELIKADRAADPVQQVLDKYNDFDFEYEGFEVEGFEDRWDPNAYYEHSTIDTTITHDDFEYSVDAVSLFEVLRDDILPKAIENNKYPGFKELQEFKRLYQLWETSTSETEEETGEAMELYLAQHLEDFVDYFYDVLAKRYEKDAYEYANDNW